MVGREFELLIPSTPVRRFAAIRAAIHPDDGADARSLVSIAKRREKRAIKIADLEILRITAAKTRRRLTMGTVQAARPFRAWGSLGEHVTQGSVRYAHLPWAVEGCRFAAHARHAAEQAVFCPEENTATRRFAALSAR